MDVTAGAEWVEAFPNEADEEEHAFMAIIDATPRGICVQPEPGGSRPGRAPNKKRDPAARHLRLLQQYFGPEPIYNEREFRTRFRMT